MTRPNTMSALVKAQPAVGLWQEQRPVPEIGPDDVLIRVKKTGICGTDIHIWNWDEWAQKTVPVPLITGHEFAGEIVDMGRNVEGLSIGQRCSGEGHLIGKTSRQSRAGRFHLDPETRGIGVNEQGAFAEYLRLPAFNVVPLPDEISDDIGAILDPLGNAVHTALSFDLLGEDVLITGAGPIGIMQAAMDVVLPYIHERKQFGKAIGEFQLVQGKLADMYVGMNSARAYVYSVAQACDRGETTREDAAGAILYASEKATQMALDAIQLLGGNGYVNDYPTGRLLRDAKLYEIGAGTSVIRRMLIGRELFEKTV